MSMDKPPEKPKMEIVHVSGKEDLSEEFTPPSSKEELDKLIILYDMEINSLITQIMEADLSEKEREKIKETLESKKEILEKLKKINV